MPPRRSRCYYKGFQSEAGGHKEGPAPRVTLKDPKSARQLQIALDSSSVTTSERNNTINLLPSSRREAVLEQQLLQQWELLGAQAAEVMKCLKKVRRQRDTYAEQLKTERAQWQQKMLQMAGEIEEILKMEKKQDAIKIEELKRSPAHLQNHLAEPLAGKAGTSTQGH
ncbi:golgin subfamily A member 8B-like [Aotus nancymaae]|uniref:golgin subfamily A member 8B-like n=1 Tax=Aotus nancymaae TaxID=37293 RepID=UPI0030FED4F4